LLKEVTVGGRRQLGLPMQAGGEPPNGSTAAATAMIVF
jgi:hypothetical protein